MTNDLNELRPRMMSIAYRMLGSVADAEDAVQDAFLRLHTAGGIASVEGFLVRVTTRLCIDRLRSRQRIEYVGPWVPEPVETAGRESIYAESLTQAFLLLLERLTPNERAALLLRVVFDYEYTEIAGVLGRPEATVRQLVSRARQRVGLGEQRFHVDTTQANSMAEQFVTACKAGDLKAIEGMLTQDVEIHSDGGGKRSAALVVIRGPERVARFLAGVFHKHRDHEMTPTTVNGQPGLVFRHEGEVIQVASLSLGEGVRAIYITRNPDKLTRWSMTEFE